MLLQFKNLKIRNATVKDADLLSSWWNDYGSCRFSQWDW